MTTCILTQEGIRTAAAGGDPDILLVRRFLEDPDPLAFAELVRRHEGPVLRLCSSILGPGFEADAEDLAQEIFVHVYHSLTGFRFASRFSTWLYRVAYRKAIDRKRLARFSRPHAGTEAIEQRASATASALGTLIENEQAAAIGRAVDTLPTSHRTAVRLYYWQGCSVDEIAQLTGTRVATVKSWLFRARKRLAVVLQESP